MSSKKLLEQCQKLEKLWSHVFTATITLANITQENQWYNKLTDMIDKQQTAPIWMSDAKVKEQDFCNYLKSFDHHFFFFSLMNPWQMISSSPCLPAFRTIRLQKVTANSANPRHHGI